MTNLPDLKTLHRQALYATFRHHGFAPPFAVFGSCGEGEFMPMGTEDDPVEESCGFILTKDGTVHSYWFMWDEDAEHPTLDLKLVEEPDRIFSDYSEYLEARRFLLGLS